ncbi:hypothetical protein SeMB42_g05398 [Synchytrium endobioticum]|uniref:Uncharacterized protein n=1 Tax=Synchytrium endobioticum TaxID=286115 RepID=A0A507CRZ6_9FUNG|nr:hypothetical protein SeMB42_g05398 [Synchytrium endobioticum]
MLTTAPPKTTHMTDATERPASASPVWTELDAYDADALDALVYQVLLYGLCRQYASPAEWDDLTRKKGILDIVWTDDELEAHLMQITNDARFSLREVASDPLHFRHLLSSESLQRVQIAFVWNALRQVLAGEKHVYRLELLESVLHLVRQGFMFGDYKLKSLHYEFAKGLQTQIAAEMATKKPNDISNEKYWLPIFATSTGQQPFAERQYHSFLKSLQSEAAAASSDRAKVKDFRDKYSLEGFVRLSEESMVFKITLPIMDSPPKSVRAKPLRRMSFYSQLPPATHIEYNRQPTTPYIILDDDDEPQTEAPFSTKDPAIRVHSDKGKQKKRLRKSSPLMSPNQYDPAMMIQDPPDLFENSIYVNKDYVVVDGDEPNDETPAVRGPQPLQQTQPALPSREVDMQILEQDVERRRQRYEDQKETLGNTSKKMPDISRSPSERERSPIRSPAPAAPRRETQVAVQAVADPTPEPP